MQIHAKKPFDCHILDTGWMDIDDGEMVEIRFCPFCGSKLQVWEKPL